MKKVDRIQNCFANGKAFVGYLTAGDGGVERTLTAALALIQGGVNLLEIGLPFSDPIADGPVIQQASARALANGACFEHIRWLVKEIRKNSQIPLILFSYLNPLLPELKNNAFADLDVDGILVVDCPLEESHRFYPSCLEKGIAPIYIISPTTPLERIQQINKLAKGFLYYACRKGTTGMQTELPQQLAEKLKWIKSLVHLPVVVGFGVSNQNDAASILNYADGVVVGSLFVNAVAQGKTALELRTLAEKINPLRQQNLSKLVI